MTKTNKVLAYIAGLTLFLFWGLISFKERPIAPEFGEQMVLDIGTNYPLLVK